MKSPQRKTLRQRVADRKRGIKEPKPVSKKQEKAMKLFILFLNVMQYLGIAMLVLTVGETIKNNYQVSSWDLVAIYSAMFLLGRGGLTVLKIMNDFK